MKKVLIVIAAALLALTSCSKKIEKGEFTIEQGKFKVGVEIGYPPFEYYAEDGKTPLGFDIEMGKAIAEKLGLEVEIIDTAWDGIFAGLQTDKYDVVISAATITPERLESMEFSAPYIGNGQALIVVKNSKFDGKVKGPEDLKGLTVGYQAETTSDIYITKFAEKTGLKFSPAEYDKVINAYDDLKLGRNDAVISDSLVAVDYLNVENSPFTWAWQGEADEFFGIAIKKGNTALLDKVNAALAEIKADGTLKGISESIFGMDFVSSLSN